MKLARNSFFKRTFYIVGTSTILSKTTLPNRILLHESFIRFNFRVTIHVLVGSVICPLAIPNSLTIRFIQNIGSKYRSKYHLFRVPEMSLHERYSYNLWVYVQSTLVIVITQKRHLARKSSYHSAKTYTKWPSCKPKSIYLLQDKSTEMSSYWIKEI